MLADVEWSNLTVSGAFLLGAVLATFAMLRVVRAVTSIFRDDPKQQRRQHRRDNQEDSDAE